MAEQLDLPTGDFVVSSSGSTPDEVRATLAKADSPPAAEPPAKPAAEPAAEPEPVAAAPAAETEPGAEPAAEEAVDPVADAAARLPKGDSKAGRTLSERGRTIQAEIHQLTYQKHQTKLEFEAEQTALAELRRERERIYTEIAQRTAPAAPTVQKPKSENFDTFEEYTDALGQFYRDEAKRDALAEAQQLVQQVLADERARAQAYQQQQELNQVYTQHQTNVEAARTAHPDFDEVVAGSALPTNPMMEAHIPRSSVSGELLHYLATHPDECVQIAQLPAGPTLVALGRLEARIEGVKSGPPPARSPVVSRAQRPIKPVGASGAAADEIPDANVSLDEHVAFWNRKDRERRSGGARG